MKKILAIINDPKESKEFIRYVASMAVDIEANVHLLYVQNQTIKYPMGSTGYAGVKPVEQMRQQSEAMAKSAKEILTDHIKDVKSKIAEKVKITCSTELGVTSLLVKELVSNNKADMVVLEGHRNESSWTQTSHNMDIIKNVECPVWIVPREWVYKPFSNIIYATDYKEEDITGLKRLIALTDQFSPNITALHLTDSDDFDERVKKAGFLELMKKRADYDNLSIKILNDNSSLNIAELLNDYVFRVRADLVVVLKENNTFFERIFKSDPAKKIIKKSILPVLVFHEKE